MYCDYNQLTLLDVSNNTKLEDLRCDQNQITSLDLSNNKLLESFVAIYNEFNIGQICGVYNVKKLPGNFDTTKSSDWQGAVLDGNKITEFDGTGAVTYNYDCGYDEPVTFTLRYTLVEHSYDEGVITVEPTEETEGEMTYTCTVCGETKTETIDKLPSTSEPPASDDKEEIQIDISKNGWGNHVKEIDAADENTTINVEMGNTTNIPKNVLDAIEGRDIDLVLNMGNGISWTINGKDITDPQPINLKVAIKENAIPDELITDTENTAPLVLEHEGNFGFKATLSINLESNDNKYANLYYYNKKTKQLELVDVCLIENGKANLDFTHTSDWAIVISDTSNEPESSNPDTGIDLRTLLYIIVILSAVSGVCAITAFVKHRAK